MAVNMSLVSRHHQLLSMCTALRWRGRRVPALNSRRRRHPWRRLPPRPPPPDPPLCRSPPPAHHTFISLAGANNRSNRQLPSSRLLHFTGAHAIAPHLDRQCGLHPGNAIRLAQSISPPISPLAHSNPARVPVACPRPRTPSIEEVRKRTTAVPSCYHEANSTSRTPRP